MNWDSLQELILKNASSCLMRMPKRAADTESSCDNVKKQGKIGQENSKRILRAMLWHEEGVFLQYFDSMLPTELPMDLHQALSFLRRIVPTTNELDFTKNAAISQIHKQKRTFNF